MTNQEYIRSFDNEEFSHWLCKLLSMEYEPESDSEFDKWLFKIVNAWCNDEYTGSTDIEVTEGGAK